ncbi:thiamine pyrophosphate-binding protein, partial [Kribbia dieselivorans]|uniref:thiamine pyrophosphate-binding protein n=1 Tax=Kribbia dieselivorans TaxID=331526 RepID=UPI000A615A90
RPERVVVVGRPTLTRAVGALLRHPQVRVETVTAGLPWSDPGHVARAVYPWAALTADTEVTAGSDWGADWRQAATIAQAAIAEVLGGDEGPGSDEGPDSQALPDGRAGLSGPTVARTVMAHLPAGARLFVGSSNPVRDLDLAAAPRHDGGAGPLQVVAGRGLAGIDGCLATTFGLALADDRPTYALVGDLTFLHDTNALLIGPGERRPNVTIVVPNDDGGGIFTTLEYGAPQRARDFERIFGTPTGTDLAAVCAAHGVDHVRVSDSAALAAAVAQPPSGVRVVEVPVRRSGHRDLHARLREAVDTALHPAPNPALP